MKLFFDDGLQPMQLKLKPIKIKLKFSQVKLFCFGKNCLRMSEKLTSNQVVKADLAGRLDEEVDRVGCLLGDFIKLFTWLVACYGIFMKL